MIYEINNKYYVKVGYEYNEIEMKLDNNDDVVLIPLKNRIDGNGKQIKEIVFLSEKENFKNKLKHKQETKPIVRENKPTITEKKKHKWS